MIAIPAFFYDLKRENKDAGVISERTQDYVTSKKLLLSGAEAIERIMLAIKEVNELAGYTFRVYEMIQVFKDMKDEKYIKNFMKTEKKKSSSLEINVSPSMTYSWHHSLQLPAEL